MFFGLKAYLKFQKLLNGKIKCNMLGESLCTLHTKTRSMFRGSYLRYSIPVLRLVAYTSGVA